MRLPCGLPIRGTDKAAGSLKGGKAIAATPDRIANQLYWTWLQSLFWQTLGYQ